MKAIVMRARGPPSELFKSPLNNLNDLEEHSMKIITIKDYYGNYQEVPVDDALYAEWQELQRESDRIRKKEYYHGSGVPFDTVESCYAADGGDYLEQMVWKDECRRLYNAIAMLPLEQQRRVYMFMDNMTYADIARVEGRSHPAIRKSLLNAFNHLRQLLEE